MKKGIFLSVLLFLLTIPSFSALAAELQNINFLQDGEVSKLELFFDSTDVKANKFNVIEDKQLIIDLKNVTASPRVKRGFDTSEFSGGIVYVKAYARPSHPQDLRVTIQLRDNVRSRLQLIQNKMLIEVENRYGVFSETQIRRRDQLSNEQKTIGQLNIPKSDSVIDILDSLTQSGPKKYIGKRITINVKNVKVVDVLNMIADSSGFNIILTEDVKKREPLSLNLTKIPWDQALDTVLGLNKLVARKNGNILLITTLERATREKKLEFEAMQTTKKQEPLITKVFPVSYSDIKDLTKIITEYLSSRGKISLDDRINAIIVKDTVSTIEKIRKMIETLDAQTPQVLIESKIVEVTESYKKEIGLQNGLTFGYDPVGTTGDRATSDVGGTVKKGLEGGPGFSFSSAPVSGKVSRSLFGLNIKRFNRIVDLNLSLQLMEFESKGKVVASPKVITQNKKPATISTKDTTSFAVVSGTGDSKTTSFENVEAVLELTVTPQVTNDGAIVLKIDLIKEQFGVPPATNAPPDKATRSVKTNVLVENGSTIVIGGVYSFEKTESHSGVPFLKDLPLIGWLFRTPYNPATKKSELIIFITPRVINQKQAGFGES